MSKIYRGLGQAAGFLDCDLLQRASQILIQGKRNPEKALLLRDCIAIAAAMINLELSAWVFCL